MNEIDAQEQKSHEVTDELFSVVTQAVPDPKVFHVRARSPKAAVEQVEKDGKRKVLLVARGYVVPLDPEADNLKRLKPHQVPHHHAVTLSGVRAGEDAYALMTGFFDLEPATFLVHVEQEEGDEGHVRISPLFVSVDTIPRRLIRGPDGDLVEESQ